MISHMPFDKPVPNFPIRIESSLNNLAAIKNAGIKVLAGTDANLEDRGVIDVGKRADLVLVQGDPTVDMDCIRNIYKVWINGLPVS